MGSSHHKLKPKQSQVKYDKNTRGSVAAEGSLISTGALNTGRSKYSDENGGKDMLQTPNQDSTVLFQTPDKINMQSPAPSPASYALSGYNRRIIHFFEVLLPVEFRPGKGRGALHTTRLIGAHLDTFVRTIP